MIDGTYVEHPTDLHVRLRRDLLESGAVLPPPLPQAIEARAADFPQGVEERLLSKLRGFGLAIIQLDQPLSNDQFIVFGSRLGKTIPELDPSVKPYVESDVLLNLVSEHEHTADVAIQPFSTNFLTLHTECSARRAEEQPRFIMLMCCELGDYTTSAQTLAIPMTAVDRHLSSDIIAALAQTRYRCSRHGPMIVRNLDRRRVFSFRDFHPQAIEWTYNGDDLDEDALNAGFRALLAAMYAPDAATGVHWKCGMLVIIDNTFFFHGRTASLTTTPSRHRHLKRLRIIAPCEVDRRSEHF